MTGKDIKTQEIARLVAQEKAVASGPRDWQLVVDELISHRLSVAGMTRVLNAMGYVVGRRRVNCWILCHRREETEYLRKKKKGVEHQKQTGKVEPVADKVGAGHKESSTALSAAVSSKEALNDCPDPAVPADAKPSTEEAPKPRRNIGLDPERVVAFIKDPRNRI